MEAGIVSRQSLVREGVISGMIGATSVAVWFLILDTIAGHPFHTPRVLGTGFFNLLAPNMSSDSPAMVIAGYTTFHYLAFAILGIIAAALVRVSQREPNVVAGLVLLFVAFEAGFYGLAALLTKSELLGSLAWWQVGVANLIAAAMMGAYMLKRHPELRQRLEHASGKHDE